MSTKVYILKNKNNKFNILERLHKVHTKTLNF